MSLSIRLHCCTILLLLALIPLQTLAQGGLKFHGNEQPINQRTTYNVFGDQTPEFSGDYTLAFNLSLYPASEFGYIVRIKNTDSNRIYHLFYDGQGSRLIFQFNEEGKNNLITASLDKEELLNLHWFRMKISFDLTSDSIHLTIHNRTYGAGHQELPDTYHPVILFGKSDHIIDVPSFAIKDLAIGDNKDKVAFALNESEGIVAHDARGKATGQVTNPEWLINDAYHWRYKVTFQSQSVAGANYNPERKEVYYFNRDSLYRYNVRSGETSVRVFEQKCPVDLILGTNFLDARHEKLYSYEAYYPPPRDNYTGPTLASLDLNTYRWTAENYQQLISPLHHHGSYLDPVTRQYVLFGGFGKMHYSKDFFAYDLAKKDWDTLAGFTGDPLSPRYFCSVGYLPRTNSVYVFGGMGNESGQQTVGRKYYYDLHKIDLNTRRISKLWEIPWERDNVVPVRGMVILDDSCFYTLCYPEHFSESQLKLYRFSLKDGSYEILGDSIPIYSDKITTNANLYYDNSLNNLYAVVQEFDDDISSDLKVYALSFPPITAQELAGYARNRSSSTPVILVITALLVTGLGYLLYRKLKKPRQRDVTPDDDDLYIPETGSKPETTSPRTEVPTRPNAIYLFGDFTVRDRHNRDITYMFSAQLKQVFCLILQYSTTDDGIASQRLSTILWPDRPADKVKNSRGVTINHLRKVLSEMDGIELIYDKGHFKIAQSDPFYCDYTRCMQIITAHESEKHKDELASILSRGKFLQLSDHPLYSAFKEEFVTEYKKATGTDYPHPYKSLG